ncbi:MAG: ATP synthase F1 subunit epsilon [Deltaproteobacteria bacterium]|nr:ATP synthase F1 subunit epsilon [Deltaproteobacteria bacterium]
MNLQLITPESAIFKGEVSSVTLPGEMGQLTVLPGHTVLLAKLASGKAKFTAKEGEKVYTLGPGTLEVSNDKVTVLVASATAQ